MTKLARRVARRYLAAGSHHALKDFEESVGAYITSLEGDGQALEREMKRISSKYPALKGRSDLDMAMTHVGKALSALSRLSDKVDSLFTDLTDD
jgi:hypothetical protein